MNTALLRQELYEYISGLEIVDCHEHIIDEKLAVETKADFTLLVCQYNRNDFLSAGMKREDWEMLYAPETDLEHKWKIYEKWAPYV